MQRWIAFFTLTLLLCPITYANTKFPRGCEAVGYEFKDMNAVLQPKQQEGEDSLQTLYMLRNASRNTLIVRNHVNKEAIVAPVWEATIYHNRWAAFATNKPLTKFQCQTQSRAQQKTIIDCKDVIEICQYPRAKFSISNFGTYWVTSNQSQSGAIRQAVQKGILLRW